MLTDRPSDASAVFEHLSASVKEATVTPVNLTPSKGEQIAMAKQLKWAQSSQALFAVPDEPPEGGAVVPDMLDEANMWEWGGVSFGRLETYRLYLSVKKVGTELITSRANHHESLCDFQRDNVSKKSDDHRIAISTAPDLSGSGRVDTPTRPVAAA